MNLHHYDNVTLLYSHSAVAPEDPMATKRKGEFVAKKLPFTTAKSLPVLQVDQAAKFNVAANNWDVLESHIGKRAYSTVDKSEQLIDEVGPVADGFTLEKPSIHDEWVVDQWVRDDTAYFADLLEKKTNSLNAACAQEITSGFVSNALGTAHRYSSDLDDQMNISGNVLAATLGDATYHACYDADNLRDFRAHNPDQMIQVGRDLSAHKLTCLQQATALKSQAQAAAQAQDEVALTAVVWPAA